MLGQVEQRQRGESESECTPERSHKTVVLEKKSSASGTRDLKSFGSSRAITEQERAYRHTRSIARSWRVVTMRRRTAAQANGCHASPSPLSQSGHAGKSYARGGRPMRRRKAIRNKGSGRGGARACGINQRPDSFERQDTSLMRSETEQSLLSRKRSKAALAVTRENLLKSTCRINVLKARN